MKKIAVVVAACLLVCGGPAAQGAINAASPQAIYDKAQSAYDAGHWLDAGNGFAQLLPQNNARVLARSEAVIAYRYADCLLHLDRLDEAIAWIDRALPTLEHDTDPQFMAEALFIRGTVQRIRYDYAAAVEDYDSANRLLAGRRPSDVAYEIAIGLAFADVTHDAPHVLQQLQLISSTPEFSQNPNRALKAQVEDLEARAEMNLGDLPAAKRLVEKAINDSGGLNERVSINEIAMRADAGIIAHLRHDDDEVQRYFTYTGAGHLLDLSWVNDHAGELPLCRDSASGPSPADIAIVTFAIADDGRVVNANPVYASRAGEIGQIFSQAVSEWRWDPAEIKKVDPFWRTTLQLELRCVKRPRSLSFEDATQRAATDWLRAHGLLTPAEIAFAENGGWFTVGSTDPRLTHPDGAVLAAVAEQAPSDNRDIEALWARLDAVHAPPAAYVLLSEHYADRRRGGSFGKSGAAVNARALAEWLPRLRQRFPDDPAIYQVILDEALMLQTARDYKASAPYLAYLTDLPETRLAKGDPLRAVALLHQAITLDHMGQGAAARLTLDQSGLNSSQCTLFDTHPLPQNQYIGSDAFPQAAQRWSFEGYVQTDFDIADSGKVENVRAVISYPPFIFEDTTDQAVSRFRFEPPRLGGKVVGCDDQREIVNYRISN